MGDGSDTSGERFDPLDIAFDTAREREAAVSAAGTRITFSPAPHHQGLLELSTALELYHAGQESEVQGRGMYSAGETLHLPYQLQTEYGSDVETGVFAEITTPAHDAHPCVIIFGFAMAPTTPAFSFPNVVRERIGNIFDDADRVAATRDRLVAITDDYALQDQVIDRFLGRTDPALPLAGE